MIDRKDNQSVSASKKPKATGNQVRYLMFNHGGVLDGQVVQDISGLTDNDLVLEYYDWGGAQVLKNGVDVVNYLNQLVNDHGYQVLFTSSNSEDDQLKLLEQLKNACSSKDLNFPKVSGMAVYDESLKGTSSNNPIPYLTKKDQIPAVTWGADIQDGQASLRRALETQFGIDTQERKNHIVFDDGPTNVRAASAEGYQTYLIGDQISLDAALKQVLALQAEKLAKADPEVRSAKPTPQKPIRKKLSPDLKKALDDLKTHLTKLENYGSTLKERSYNKITNSYNVNSKEYIKGEQIKLIAETLKNDFDCFNKSITKDSFKDFLKKSTTTLDLQRDTLQTHRDEWVPYLVIAGNILFALTGIGALILAGNAIYVSTTREGLNLHSAFFGMRTISENIALEVESDLEEIALRM